MSNQNDTNELDNYGVWVKKPPKDIKADAGLTDESFSLDTDFPDFDSLGGDSDGTQYSSDDFSFSDDADGGAQTEENTFDIDEPIIETPSGDIMSEQTFDSTDSFSEDAVSEDASKNSTDYSDLIESSESTDSTESTDSFDINLDGMEDGEIDLDNFISDSSSGSETEDVSADFNVDSAGTESLDLGDFLDSDEFSDFTSDSKPKQEEIVDEDPLDIKLDFDESADSFAVEDENTESDVQSEHTEPQAAAAETESIDTESIDLSSFGIDENDMEQPVSGLEDSINSPAKEVVDYDLKVSADTDDDTAVSMNDVISGNIVSDTADDTIEEQPEEPEPETKTEAPSSEISLKEQEILQQIVSELSSLKSEIKHLKTDFEDLKSREKDVTIPEEKEEKSGFFADSDDDDTIALSGDELDNILNNAEFLDETETAPASETQEQSAEKTEDSAPAEEQFESTVMDDGGALFGTDDDSETDFSVGEESAETEQDSSIDAEDETADSSTAETEFDAGDADGAEQETVFEEPADENAQDDFQEPEIEDTVEEETEEDFSPEISEDLPDEIEIPKVDDFSDLPDETAADSDDITIDESVSEEEAEESADDSQTEEDTIEQEAAEDDVTLTSPIDQMFGEDKSIEDSLTSEKLDYISSDENNGIEQNQAETEGDIEITESEEPVFDETSVDEPVVEEQNDTDIFSGLSETATETESDETVSEQNADEDETVSVSSAPSDTEEPADTDISNGEIPSDLKQEIKSVLSYMDQLLENLPEDKISEFAQSEHFVTYKKLFQELGLS